MQFRPPVRTDIPCLGLDQAGRERMLFSLFGTVEYTAEDSEILARHLEQAAAMVRKHA